MTVHLVGAGPGDVELLTVRAARLIRSADVVLVDRLVSPEILALAPSSAEIIDVGKRPGCSNVQDVINELLVTVGRDRPEAVIVRLKGGDPFLFGRGGEEAEALAAAGVEYAVVPGITSAFAGPMAAGIPVTHRDCARAVTVVTGHEAEHSPLVDWRALAALGESHTIVVLMGVERRSSIARHLIAGGADPATPVAFVERATTASQRVVIGVLADSADLVVASPAVWVIGAVAAFADVAASVVAASVQA